MDEFIQTDRNWEKILHELSALDGSGYKDLKDEKNREFMRGMAWLYHEVELMRAQETDDEHMSILERIEAQASKKTLGECLEWLECSMSEMLESMLDEEA